MPTEVSTPPDPPAPVATTACIILAAGGSRRLGQPKQLLEVAGTPMLERAVGAALAVTEVWPVVVVVGAGAAAIRPLLVRHPVLITENPAWEEGMASSLRAGLATVAAFSSRIENVLFLLCDQPALDAGALRQLLAARDRGGKSIVTARYDGHAGPPTLIHRRHFAALARLTGDEGARRLIQSLPSSEIEYVDLPALALDLDTPADLARAGLPAAAAGQTDSP